MSTLDWLVLAVTLFSIVVYGIWKSRHLRNLSGYLLADRALPWYHVGLSVMATQASAITFLSAPGQAYGDGLRFVQFYFGLPLAMIVLCYAFIPRFRNLNVFTAYEYLENRFDAKTRTLTAFLFLLQRGLSTGITIYAPAIVLSTLLQIDIRITTIFTGGIVILYTVLGGTKAVSYTQLLQMLIIFSGLFIAGWMVIHLLPKEVGVAEALHIAGKMGRLNAIDTTFDLNNRYNIWSGIIGGFFLQLSYFGTDQSQVGRYLTGKSNTESKLGLIMNGMVKIPMQFFILLIGTLVFTFYQFNTPPIYFNQTEIQKLTPTSGKVAFTTIEKDYQAAQLEKREHVFQLTTALKNDNKNEINRLRTVLQQDEKKCDAMRESAFKIIQANNPGADTNDTNYVFLTFVLQQLPHGLIGLLMAIILLAAMGSTASGLNSLASTTVIDFYKRFSRKDRTEKEYVAISKWSTAGWGIFCIIVALEAGKLGNLIEAVNILGSLFYGTILGIFLTAFFLKQVKGNAVFIAAIATELLIVIAWKLELTAFLWLNVGGCLLVMAISALLQKFESPQKITAN
ncbi:MAG: sodium-solute symporter [Bacteroidota bacterium]|jgi:SSS family transporter